MKKIILAVALSLITTAAFAQLTSTSSINSNSNSSSTTTGQLSTTAQTTIDLLGSDTVAGIGTSDTVAGLGGSDSQTSNPVSSPMPAFGHTGNLRQPGSIRR
ncbi:hypothetical protein RHD99_12270 [Buttiauxella selenatireducens]|uniref:Secreted protein n=1 Tax=Buttiauxella selenatireducens TaxID=3073902 RepID=A0ABY9S443_9ENTR|nr:hypothetical protein [Buttiauxella sp. R73]WMY72273.1 hypothetical protein RHD99_12270 [Buttiauxella sp. R73]